MMSVPEAERHVTALAPNGSRAIVQQGAGQLDEAEPVGYAEWLAACSADNVDGKPGTGRQNNGDGKRRRKTVLSHDIVDGAGQNRRRPKIGGAGQNRRHPKIGGSLAVAPAAAPAARLPTATL
jgi:hypothetical protein